MAKKEYSLVSGRDMNKLIKEMADELVSLYPLNTLVFIGIIKRGDILARRIQKIIKAKSKVSIPVGKIDINLYRDDLSIIDYHPVIEYTDIPFDINRKTVILFDDVFFTGRTARCALNEIMDFGRPKAICLYTLIDRKQKELPIVPDYSGTEVKLPKSDIVNVHFRETDGKDGIFIIKEER